MYWISPKRLPKLKIVEIEIKKKSLIVSREVAHYKSGMAGQAAGFGGGGLDIPSTYYFL